MRNVRLWLFGATLTALLTAFFSMPIDAQIFGGGGGGNVTGGTGCTPPNTTAPLKGNNVGGCIAATTTGTGSVVLDTNATLTTPALGTPSALVLTNATGLPAAQLTGT